MLYVWYKRLALGLNNFHGVFLLCFSIYLTLVPLHTLITVLILVQNHILFLITVA